MTKKHNEAENQTEQALASAMDKTQDFFERNSKLFSIVLIVVLAVVAAYFGYRKLYAEPRADRAAEAIYEAQYRFEGDDADYQLALTGDEQGAGFLDVIEQYGSTPAGNVAAHYAGICYLKLGDLENAAKYLASYKPTKGVPNKIINAQNYGLQGDILVQQQRYDKAVEMYRKAVEAGDNSFTAPLYLKKAGLAYLAMGNKSEARKQFERIARQYGNSYEAREADKYVGATGE